jgi:hypothetical protein
MTCGCVCMGTTMTTGAEPDLPVDVEPGHGEHRSHDPGRPTLSTAKKRTLPQ